MKPVARLVSALAALALLGAPLHAKRNKPIPLEKLTHKTFKGGAKMPKKSQPLSVPGYRVGFVIGDRTSATSRSGGGAVARLSVALAGDLTPADFQEIVDAAYADFVDRLKAAGRTVVDAEALNASKSFQELSARFTSPHVEGRSLTHVDDAVLYAPTGLPIWFTNGDNYGGVGVFNLGPINDLRGIAKETGSVVVAPISVIHFADLESSGRKKTYAKVGAEPQMHFMSGRTGIYVVDRKEGGGLQLPAEVILSEAQGEFVTVSEESNRDQVFAASLAGQSEHARAAKVLSWKADAASYKASALEGLKAFNKALVDALAL
jgi:hypothetical protein